jgi:hypothetical protein
MVTCTIKNPTISIVSRFEGEKQTTEKAQPISDIHNTRRVYRKKAKRRAYVLVFACELFYGGLGEGSHLSDGHTAGHQLAQLVLLTQALGQGEDVGYLGGLNLEQGCRSQPTDLRGWR